MQVKLVDKYIIKVYLQENFQSNLFMHIFLVLLLKSIFPTVLTLNGFNTFPRGIIYLQKTFLIHYTSRTRHQ